MFNGYLLKINGAVYPTAYMVVPTYAVKDTPIVVSDYHDSGYGRHIVKVDKSDIEITFNIRQLFNDEFPSAITPFTNTMTVEYFDSKTGGYKTDTFTYNCNLNPTIDRRYNDRLLYKELSIKLIRKVS